jgi:hypothetical protein
VNDELLRLAERCEAATEPDNSLFKEAFSLCFPGNYMPGRSGFGPFRWDAFKAMLDAQAYLDAAISLFDKYNWTAWELRSRGGLSHFVAEISRLNTDKQQDLEVGRGKTAALAFCAAALRSRAHKEKL